MDKPEKLRGHIRTLAKAIQQNFDELLAAVNSNAREGNKLASDVAAIEQHLGVQKASDGRVLEITGGDRVEKHDELDGVTSDQHHAKVHDHTTSGEGGVISTAGPDADVTIDAAGAAGTAASEARSQHGHKLSTYSSEPPATSTTTSGTAGTSTTAPSRGNHAHDLGFDDATSNPLAVSTAAADGTEGSAARKDHVHPHEAAHVAHDTVWDTKGDLVAATGADAAAKVAIGSDGKVLTADSGAGTGVSWQTASSMPNPFALTHDITPTALAASVDDYNPTGLSTADVIRQDFGGFGIFGLAGGADGRVILLVNIGTTNGYLSQEEPTSSAANRFDFGMDNPSDFFILGPGRGLILLYDATSSRWRTVSGVQVFNASTDTVFDSVVAGSNVTLTDLGDGVLEIAASGGGGTTVATDVIWDAANDYVRGSGSNTGVRQVASAATPAAVSSSGSAGTAANPPSADDHVHGHEAAHVAHDTLWDAKGDLAGGTGADTAGKLTVGADDTILMADSAAGTGLKWVASGTPSAVGTAAAVGTADTFTRGDHVHAHETAHVAHDTIWDAANDYVRGSGADTGTVQTASAATPAAVSTSGSTGTAAHAPSADDHVHAHEAAHINHDTTWAAKGDIVAATANDAASVVTVGADGTLLKADSGAASGVSWATLASMLSAATVTKRWFVTPLMGGVDDATNTNAGTASPDLADEWAFADGGRFGSFFNTGIPSDYASGSVEVFIWWYTTTSTGNVRWLLSVSELAAGDSAGETSDKLTASGTNIADSTTVKRSSLGTWTPGAATNPLKVNLERNDTAADTATGIARVLAVEFVYTATAVATSGASVSAMDDLTDADTVSVAPGNGDYLVFDGSNWVPESAGTAVAGVWYGDGSDGAIDIDGTTTYTDFTTTTGAAPNLVYTLTRDIFATTLVVESGKTLRTGGYRIYARKVTVSGGTIQHNGNDAAANIAGGALPTATLTDNTGAGGAGKNATTGAGGNATAAAQSAQRVTTGATSGKGGVGGAAGANAAGTVGAITLMTAAEGGINFLRGMVTGVAWHLKSQSSAVNDSPHTGNGGSGGGYTHGTGTGTSGGGGSTGGVVMIISQTVINNGTISANGGNGASASVTGNDVGGGGGGGGGGIVIIFAHFFSGTTPTSTGGTHGNGAGSGGLNGNDGSTGTVITVKGP